MMGVGGCCLQWKEGSRDGIGVGGMVNLLRGFRARKNEERMKEPSLGQGESCSFMDCKFYRDGRQDYKSSNALTQAQAGLVLDVSEGPING